MLHRIVLLSALLSTGVHGQEIEERQTPQSTEELREAVLEVLQETYTPAAGIAVVNKDGTVWVEGLGMADREKGIDADEETMFRIGSTSKIFVALAVLKLQEQGKLSLKNKIKDVIPEIQFDNPWEDTNPILVEHLLEHTTGWDDLHLPELYNKGEIIPLKEALELHPHSRTSRWVPGTRMAYSNTGANVAAYIVEKISGQPYEDFVQENFFSPMQMETMTYFLSEEYKQKGATLYKEGAPSEYGHMIMRASGSINSSPKDIAKVLQFFLNRGMVDSTRLISEHSLKRMETPSTTSGARAGLTYGYGLCLYLSPYKNFNYYKHGGGVGNGISDFSYLPEYGVGYCAMINSGNPIAIRRISALIRAFQTQNLPPQEQPTPVSTSRVPRSINGYYQTISTRTEAGFDFPTLTAMRVWTEGDMLYTQEPAHLGDKIKYVAVNNNLYQSIRTKRAELIFVNDPLEGEVFELANVASGTITFAPIPGIFVFARILLFVLWILFILQAFLLFPVWMIRYWLGKIPGGPNVRIRIWPLLPPVFFVLSFALLSVGALESIEPLAKPSFFSVGVMLGTIGFFAAAVFSFVMAVRYRNKGITKAVYVTSTFLSILHVLIAFYLLWHGLIGLMTWA